MFNPSNFALRVNRNVGGKETFGRTIAQEAA